MNPVIEKGISGFVHRFVGKYYLHIAVGSLLLTGLSVWLMAVNWKVDTDLKALLPTDSPAAQSIERVGERVGSGSALFVVIAPEDADNPPERDAFMEKAKSFAADFKTRVEEERDSVALAHYHNDKTFFERHQLLFLKKKDLKTIRKRIEEKIEEKKKEANPLFADLDTSDESEDDEFIETDDIRQKYERRTLGDQRPYLTSEDGYSLTVVVRFAEPATDIVDTNRFIREVREVVNEVDPSSYHDDMTVEFGGGLMKRKRDYRRVRSDMKESAIFTIIGLLLVIGLYFRRVRATALIMVPLVMAVAWTLAVAFTIFEALNSVSAFIFAILLGLGIDYSIHLLSGYDHARMEGFDPNAALVRTYKGVGSATIIGASTTLATFIVISFANFRGLSQFGQVATIGVLFTLLAMIVVLPALILTFDQFGRHEVERNVGHDGRIEPLISLETIGWYAPLAVAVAVAFTALSIMQIPSFKFQENFRELGQIYWPWQERTTQPGTYEQRQPARNLAEEIGEQVDTRATEIRKSIDPESFHPEMEQTTTRERFRSALEGQRSSTPTVLLFDNKDAARRVSRHMRRLQRQGKLPTIMAISSIYTFMPGETKEQKRRMKEIEKIREVVNSEDLSVLDDDSRERLEKFKKKLQVEPVTIYDLPTWTKRLFHEAGGEGREPTEGDYAFEYVVYVSENFDVMRGKLARKFLDTIQSVRQETGVDFKIGSQSYIYVRMLDEIRRDGTLFIGLALVIVFLLLTLAFRSPLRGLVAMTPLILGATWMFGALSALGIRLDFFNVIIIPVVIGIGVDAGVHFYRRYLERGRGSVGIVVRTVGSAVTMASVTSGIGFGGLAITEQGGLSSIGHLAIVGISTTLVATLTVMPVILWFTEFYDIDWLLPRESDLADYAQPDDDDE